jgi:CRP-like cAMP-binding protein
MADKKCELIYLNKTAFLNLLSKFPEQDKNIRKMAQRRLKFMKEALLQEEDNTTFQLADEK